MSATPGYPLHLDWLPAALERDARRDAAAVPHHRPHRRHRQQPRHHPLGQVSVLCVFAFVELQRKVREDFTITEKAPLKAFSWLKTVSHLRHYS